jgi:hypothetical protein
LPETGGPPACRLAWLSGKTRIIQQLAFAAFSAASTDLGSTISLTIRETGVTSTDAATWSLSLYKPRILASSFAASNLRGNFRQAGKATLGGNDRLEINNPAGFF